LKYVVSLRRSRVDGSADDRPYIGLENIESWTGKRLTDPVTTVSNESSAAAVEGTSLSNTFEPGDVLFGKLRPYLAKTWVADFSGRSTTELLVMQPVHADPRFLMYLCLWRDFIDAVDASTYGSKMPRADWDFIGNMAVPIPPLPQQYAIADYLDRETAQIDALIAAKERVLGLLAEKRRALITRAVTRGLDPQARFRDSGIPWLGEIPAHWELTRLKFVARVQTGIALGKDFGGKELHDYPYLRVANVQDSFLALTDVKTISVPESEAVLYRLRAGDVLMNEGGDADKLGRGAIWTGEIEPCLHQNHVFAVRPRTITSEWLASWTSCDVAKAYFESRAKQSTNLASISATNLMELPLLRPSADEQREIVEHIRRETATLESIQSVTERSIALLNERRAALIAAAVTGQINVEMAA
jgi:type I restriction enzyme S subunit